MIWTYTPWLAIPAVVLLAYFLPKGYRLLARVVAPDLGVEPPEHPLALFATAAALLVAFVLGSALLYAIVP